jgi:hypothetical protein
VFEARKEKKAAEAYQQELTRWQTTRDAYAEMLELASSFNGGTDPELMLGAGEALFYKVTDASLVEDRQGRGTYTGGSQGLSIPVGTLGGRSVRYRVGATRGHYVQGAPAPTAIDNGTVFITDTRVLFQGAKQTRECQFAKLIGFHHSDDDASTTFSVSNRQKPTTVHYGASVGPHFDFRLALALAHFRGTVPAAVAQLQQELAQVDTRRPSAPAGITG